MFEILTVDADEVLIEQLLCLVVDPGACAQDRPEALVRIQSYRPISVPVEPGDRFLVQPIQVLFLANAIHLHDAIPKHTEDCTDPAVFRRDPRRRQCKTTLRSEPV